MGYFEIDRTNNEIKLFVPTNEVLKKREEMEEELNNYPIRIIPQSTISEPQMRLLYVLFKQYGEELGYTMIEMKEVLKEEFCYHMQIGEFSLSPYKKNPLTLSQATEFIHFIIEHAITNNINLYIMNKQQKKYRKVIEIDNWTQRYIVACIRQKMCALSGEVHDPENGHIVELHHWDSVASIGGYDQCNGLKTRFITLCKKRHDEFHTKGIESFKELHHIEGIWLNEKLVYELLNVYLGHFKLFRKELKQGKYDYLKK